MALTLCGARKRLCFRRTCVTGVLNHKVAKLWFRDTTSCAGIQRGIVDPAGGTSNQFQQAAQVLETLEEWNSYLKQNAPSFMEPSP
jgi:hypothetical protein